MFIWNDINDSCETINVVRVINWHKVKCFDQIFENKIDKEVNTDIINDSCEKKIILSIARWKST